MIVELIRNNQYIVCDENAKADCSKKFIKKLPIIYLLTKIYLSFTWIPPTNSYV